MIQANIMPQQPGPARRELRVSVMMTFICAIARKNGENGGYIPNKTVYLQKI